MFSGERPVRIGRRQPVPGRADAGARGRLRVVHDASTDPSIDELDTLLGHPLVVEPHRQSGRISPVVGDAHELAADPFAGLEEAALLLDGQG